MQMVIERMLCYCADAFQGRWHGLVATSVLHGRRAVVERIAFATFPVENGGAAGVKRTKLLLHLFENENSDKFQNLVKMAWSVNASIFLHQWSAHQA